MTPLQQFLTFTFTSQREREARKDQRTLGAVLEYSERGATPRVGQ